MRIIEILRLSEKGMSQREIAASAGCGKSTVGDLMKLCKEAGITVATCESLTDEELHHILYPKSKQAQEAIEPNWQQIHEDLATRKGLNLQYIWEEYRMGHPDGLSYSQFCRRYQKYRKATDRQVSLYHERKAGEIMEVDWMGDTLACVTNTQTGEKQTAHFFVSVIGHSLYPYVEAFSNEQELSWITANVNALNYYGGTPRIIVPDNCKTAVKTPKYYEPIINSAYWELAQHYEVAIVPTRIRKPKDKPAVEQTVGYLETWLLEWLRGQEFFSFAELNKAIRIRIGELSKRPFQKREGSRYSEFVKIDKPALGKLPRHKYEIADVKSKRVGDNYHLEYADFYYSVPYTLLGEKVTLRATSQTIEVIDKNRIRVASHLRRYSLSEGRYVTVEAHMPPNHLAEYTRRKFDGNRYRNWAEKIGENTYFVIDRILTNGKVEEQGYKSCMAILQFSKTHGTKKLEEACKRARELGSCNYTTVKKLLQNSVVTTHVPKPTPTHENIRGNAYYR